MGFFLLWIENLAVSLLFMAVVFALAARFRRRWLRWIIWVPLGLFVFLIYLALTIVAVVLEYEVPGFGWILPFLTLLISYVIGIIGLAVSGSRPASNEPSIKAAAVWPLGKLAIAFLVAVGLHLMTLWNMDLEAQRQMASLRVEAGALAMSVTPPRVPDSENAALLYEQAGQALGSALNINYSDDKSKNEEWNKWVDSMDKPDFDPKDPALVRFLQEQAGTISLIIKATKKPGCYFEHDYNRPTISMLLPELKPLVYSAKLMVLNARCKAATGDYQTAMEDVNALFIMAEHASNVPMLVGTLISAAIDSLGTKTLQNIIASHRLDARDLDLLKLNTGFSHHKSMQRALRYEEALRLNIFSEIDRMGSFQLLNENIYACRLKGSYLGFKIFLLNDEIIANQWYSDQMNTLASKPYYEVKDRLRNIIGSMNKHSDVPKSVLMPMLLPALDRCFESMTRADANRRLAEIALAMCRYRAKNGKYPENLDILVPDFIAFVPLDPFDGKPMRLKQTEGELIIYSIGPDGIDNGGAAYDKETKKGDIIFELPQAK